LDVSIGLSGEWGSSITNILRLSLVLFEYICFFILSSVSILIQVWTVNRIRGVLAE
jgi:hypothetical protein